MPTGAPKIHFGHLPTQDDPSSSYWNHFARRLQVIENKLQTGDKDTSRFASEIRSIQNDLKLYSRSTDLNSRIDGLEKERQKAFQDLYSKWEKTKTDADLRKFVDRIRDDVDRLTKKSTFHDATLQELESSLPDNVFVFKGPDGNSEITDDFWRAIRSKISSPKVWNEWMKHNHDLAYQKNPAYEIGGIMPKDYFIKIIKETFREEAKDIYASISKLDNGMKRLGRAPVQLGALAGVRLAKSQQSAVQAYTYASISVGASVLTQLSSRPFSQEHKPWLAWFAAKAFNLGWRRANPAIVALLPWTEAGEAFCSQPNAQLGVRLANKMFPKSFSIEHPPISELVDSASSAPQSVELWAHIGDSNLRKQAHLASDKIFGDRATSPVGVPTTFVLLGTGMYQPVGSWEDAWVQNFRLPIEAEDIGIPIQHILVRIDTNHGNEDYTCMYRIRVHGDVAK
jgi:Sad1 / UNC-like C-terminal